MSKYQFKLKTLRKLRHVHRDKQRTALADGYRAEQVLSDQRAALASERTELRDIQRTALSGGHLDVNRLVEAQRYDMILKATDQHLVEQEKQLAVEVERRRQAAVEADRAVRVLDLLDERQRREHQRKLRRLEVKQLDEVAMTRKPTDQFAAY